MVQNKRWLLVNYGTGPLNEQDFKLETQELPALGEGEIRVKVCYCSCDPTQIGWSRMDTYMPKVKLGDVMRALGYGVVVQSNNSKFGVGDRVSGLLGFQEYFQGKPEISGLNKVPSFISAEASMALFGMIGLTAYHLVALGNLKPKETLVVSGAAGAVGSLVCQLGRLHDMHVVGIAGSKKKCEQLIKEWGCNATVNYKSADWKQQLRAACPKGVDVYFENVGGAVTEAVWPLLNTHGRVIVCGLISTYEDNFGVGKGLPLYNSEIIVKRLKVMGFLCSDLIPNMQKVMWDLGNWHRQGKISFKVDVLDGVENCITGLKGLYEGTNTGKRLIKISEAPPPTSMSSDMVRKAAPYLGMAASLASVALGIRYYLGRSRL
eukprot:gb/GEZN01009097.1/.p1 GENE.gb/GEZN01009097.1/~~gb/GEZN01009097.1/.p1  ORF type:complete len:402 (+),score=45.71 gb/GEZN01009097.1/:76-1206(+)